MRLPSDPKVHIGEARVVPAGPRETLRESKADRIGVNNGDDGNR